MSHLRLRSDFLSAMSRTACTVSVVTTNGSAGRLGVTVSSLSSVSADAPGPVLLVCIHDRCRVAEAVACNGVFCVNILREEQALISDVFAGRLPKLAADRFSCADWIEAPSGCPRLVGALTALDCDLNGAHRVGTHHLLLGSVRSVILPDCGAPLVYSNRRYGTFASVNKREPLI